MQTPILTAPEAQSRTTFFALMNALSHPGQTFELELAIDALPHNLLAIGESLLDLETSFFTSNLELGEALTRTSARSETPDSAEYHFYPVLTPAMLEMVQVAPVGDMVYPDRGATLIIGCRFNCGPTLKLSGPGIQSEETFRVNSLPVDFWSLRAETIRYPLGWDIFLVHDNQVVGIPRTTEITIE